MNLLKQIKDRLMAWKNRMAAQPLEEAEAMILECHPTGPSKYGLLQAKLLLQVSPREGRNYLVECENSFSGNDAGAWSAGTRIKIYYHRNHPMKIQLMKNPV